MTKDEMQEIVERKGVKVKAIDAKPYRFALPCLIGPEERPTLNMMCCRRMMSDGKIGWLLDTHNCFSAAPDEELTLVPVDYIKTEEQRMRIDEDDEKMMRAREEQGRDGD